MMTGGFDFDVVTGPSGADTPRACALAEPRKDKPARNDMATCAAPAPKARRRE